MIAVGRSEFLHDAAAGARLLRQLPGFLRRPLVLEEAREILRQRLAHRGADFLSLARRTIFAVPGHPYRILFERIGCEYTDLERLVKNEGLEGALGVLLREGVYLTVDEFKGRRPVLRGGVSFEVNPAALRNPLARPAVAAATSGSRGSREGATHVPLDLASIRDRAVNTLLALDARGGERWRNAVWMAPGLAPALWYSLSGLPLARWFSQLDPHAPGLSARYRWSGQVVGWVSRYCAVPLPRLEYVPLGAPLAIARWMEATLRSGEVPHLFAFASSVVRLCRAAAEAGLDLAGAQFTITGEPVTRSRLEAIRRTGAEAVPDYGSADCGGSLTAGCLRAEHPDEVHFFHDLHALVQDRGGWLPDGTLAVSSLRSTAPFVLLNVSLGDRAVVSTRCCDCPLEALGWTTHLHAIRSEEKLTAGGMTFLDADIVRILEETLPARFGGGVTDYQLVEEESDRDGGPRLRLLVSPSVGRLNPIAVGDAFLEAIGSASATSRAMAQQWREGDYLRVERREAMAVGSGKIRHVLGSSNR